VQVLCCRCMESPWQRIEEAMKAGRVIIVGAACVMAQT
jgi:hypothetical protein